MRSDLAQRQEEMKVRMKNVAGKSGQGVKLGRAGAKNHWRAYNGAIAVLLPDGQEALVDVEDWPLLKKYRWRATLSANIWYCVCSVWVNGSSRLLTMHRLLLNPPEDQVVDHANGNGLDNRRANLRICSSADNSRNARFRSSRPRSSRMKGVTRTSKGWRAQILIDGVKRNLGTYKTEQEAGVAYYVAAREAFGEFAWFPDCQLEVARKVASAQNLIIEEPQ